MKKIVIPFLSFLILLSCDSEPVQNSKELNLITPIDDEHSPTLNKIEKKLNAFNDNLTEFIDCKSVSSSPSGCKEYLAKSVSEYYGISDLMEAGNYIDYDKIPDKIAELDSWEKIGDFTEKNIQTAELLNRNLKLLTENKVKNDITNNFIDLKNYEVKKGSYINKLDEIKNINNTHILYFNPLLIT